MVECNGAECSPDSGLQDDVGVDNAAADSANESANESANDSAGDVSDVDDSSDLATDGNAFAVSAAQHNERANFGNIAVKNSTDIHFGNKTFYQGPVTIKQFVYATGADGELKNGHDYEVKCTEHRQLEILSSETNKNELIVQTISNGISKGQEKSGKAKVPFRKAAVSVAVILSVLTAMITVIIVLSTKTNLKDGFREDKTSNGIDYIPPNANYPFNLSGKLRILSRKQWLAQPTAEPPDLLDLPVPYVIISHTATENCTSQSECTFIVRTAQTFHIDSQGWNDIAYNFLVGGEGYAYEGRGWDNVGAHTFGYNVCSIGISFIGTFVNLHPPARQMLAARQLIQKGVELGKIRSDYLMIGHRQASATESPGQALFDDIKALPHWLETPLSCDQARQRNAA